jgi:hypothetical protein
MDHVASVVLTYLQNFDLVAGSFLDNFISCRLCSTHRPTYHVYICTFGCRVHGHFFSYSRVSSKFVIEKIMPNLSVSNIFESTHHFQTLSFPENKSLVFRSVCNHMERNNNSYSYPVMTITFPSRLTPSAPSSPTLISALDCLGLVYPLTCFKYPVLYRRRTSQQKWELLYALVSRAV